VESWPPRVGKSDEGESLLAVRPGSNSVDWVQLDGRPFCSTPLDRDRTDLCRSLGLRDLNR
jgi:hypothetical protein